MDAELVEPTKPDWLCDECGERMVYDFSRDAYVHYDSFLMACEVLADAQTPTPHHRFATPLADPHDPPGPKRSFDNSPLVFDGDIPTRTILEERPMRDGRNAGACPERSEGGLVCGGERFHPGQHMGIDEEDYVVCWGENLSPHVGKGKRGPG